MRAVLIGATLAATAGPAAAQAVSAFVGGVQTRYADSVSGTAATGSLRLSKAGARWAGTFDAGVSRFASGEWVARFVGSGTALFGVGPYASVGVAGGGDAQHLEGEGTGGAWSGALAAGPLVAFARNRFLATLGASLGSTRTIQDSSIGTAVVRAGFRHATDEGVAVSGGALGVSADTIEYIDFSLELAYGARSLRTSLVGGVRAGDLGDDPWAQADVELDLNPWSTIEVAIGRYPRDLVGFNDGLFATVGARFGLTTAARRPDVVGPPVSVEPIGAGRVRVVIEFGREVERLDIAGDWNGWMPLPLQRAGRHRWWAEFLLDRGIHRYALVIDGVEWTVPDGVPTEPDDFGGEVALLVVR